MRISDWRSDVCSSDLPAGAGARNLATGRLRAHCFERRTRRGRPLAAPVAARGAVPRPACADAPAAFAALARGPRAPRRPPAQLDPRQRTGRAAGPRPGPRSEEHTSELQSLMRISYAVFCLKKKNKLNTGQKTCDKIAKPPIQNQSTKTQH